MKTRWALAVLLVAASISPSLPAQTRVENPHFAQGIKGSKVLLKSVVENASAEVEFNRHYLISRTPCGKGCARYWLIDVRNGLIMVAPTQAGPNEAVRQFVAKPDSPVVWVIYGPKSESSRKCSAQRYRMYQAEDAAFFHVTGQRKELDCPIGKVTTIPQTLP